MGCIPYQESLLVFDTVYFCVAGNFEVGGILSTFSREGGKMSLQKVSNNCPPALILGLISQIALKCGGEIFFEVSVSQML